MRTLGSDERPRSAIGSSSSHPGPPLLPRVAAGDRDAVGRCQDRYLGLVWSIASSVLGAGPDAEDATQDTFIDLWRSAGRFDPRRGSEPTFVAMLARRRTTDRLRRRTRRVDRDAFGGGGGGGGGRAGGGDAGGGVGWAGTAAPPLAADGRPPPEQILSAEEEVARVLHALDQLDPPRPALLRAHYCEGRTHAELVEAFGLPLGTVKSRLRRGIAAVRSALGAADDAADSRAPI